MLHFIAARISMFSVCFTVLLVISTAVICEYFAESTCSSRGRYSSDDESDTLSPEELRKNTTNNKFFSDDF
jgi:hypothetical protein